jgi:hypothetical protein
MKILIVTCCVCLAVCCLPAYGNASGTSEKGDKIEVIKDFEVVTGDAAGETGSGYIFGISKHSLMAVSGPIIWVAMALAIVTRHVRLKGRVKQLLTVHRICGYTAFGVGTIHGIFGLFF